MVALLAMLALPLTGILTLPETFAGFSDPNVILIAALFVVGEGLVRTGIVNRIGDFLLYRAGENEARLITLLMLAVALLGSIMSSTGVVAIFIPVALFMAERRKLSPSRLMMPLSFAGLISGMLTLVGTPPNLVIDSALQQAGNKGFGFFSFTPFGLVILAAGIGYMLIARRWLSNKRETTKLGRRRTLMDFVHDYDLSAHGHRMRVGTNSPAIAQTLQELGLRAQHGANIVAVERIIGRKQEILEPSGDLKLQANDILLIHVPHPSEDTRDQLQALFHEEPLQRSDGHFTDRSRDLGMAEVLLPPDSQLIGQTVRTSAFRSKHRLNVIGLRRKREAMSGIIDEKLQAGDTLLVMGRWTNIHELQSQNNDFLVLCLPMEMDHVALAGSRAPQALACLILMVLLMVTGWMPNVLAALIACVLMILAGCLSLNHAYRSIQWPSLMVIVGMMPFSIALQKTGGVGLAVDGLLRVFGDAEPRVLLGALFALTALISMFVSNTATAVLMAPIALKVASTMGASPYPFAMTVALAASASFITPVSSPVNTLVLGPGRYRFGDFVRIGVPFTIVALILTALLVPWLLPLYP